MKRPRRWALTFHGSLVSLHHTKDTYYRRLVAFYVSECRRWMRRAREAEGMTGGMSDCNR